MSIIVGRPINGISLNGLEYLLDDDCNEMKFEDKGSCIQFLKDMGFDHFTDEDFEDTFMFEEVE